MSCSRSCHRSGWVAATMKMRSSGGDMARARPRGIMAAAFIAVFWPSAVPSPVQAQTARLVSASAVERHASHLTPRPHQRHRERRSRRAAAGRDGIDARRHDGDHGCRRSRPLHARCVAVGGVRPARAHERLCGVAPTVGPRGCVADGLSPAVAPARFNRRHERCRAG